MNNKTFWFGWVAVYVAMQAIGFVIHGVLMTDAYNEMGDVFRPQEVIDSMMGIMLVSSAVGLFLFCYIFTKGYEGKGIMEGVRYGALMGLFLGIPTSIDAYVIYPITQELAMIWLASSVIGLAIGGAVFAAIYKPEGHQEATESVGPE